MAPAVGVLHSLEEPCSVRGWASSADKLIISESLLLRNYYIICPLVICFLEQFHKLGK